MVLGSRNLGERETEAPGVKLARFHPVGKKMRITLSITRTPANKGVVPTPDAAAACGTGCGTRTGPTADERVENYCNA